MSDERDDRFWNEQIKNGKSRPTQEPLQVIEGLERALKIHDMNHHLGLADIDILAQAAKAYQQALEKQEK